MFYLGIVKRGLKLLTENGLCGISDGTSSFGKIRLPTPSRHLRELSARLVPNYSIKATELLI